LKAELPRVGAASVPHTLFLVGPRLEAQVASFGAEAEPTRGAV